MKTKITFSIIAGVTLLLVIGISCAVILAPYSQKYGMLDPRGGLLYSAEPIPKNKLNDFRRIASQEYDTVFFSMYPVDTYRKEDFSYYRAMTTLKASYCLSNFSMLTEYMEQVELAGRDVTTVYLGIRPDLTDPERLTEMIVDQPYLDFEIILSYPDAEYWTQLTDGEYEEALEQYRYFLSTAPILYPDAGLYFIGFEEWLITNPANYESDFLTNEDISRAIMLNSDRLHGYVVTSENADDIADSLAELTKQLRKDPEDFPDLTGQQVVFLGDSVIGNFSDSSSIPGVFAGLTGAAVYNCGHGGCSAISTSENAVSLPYLADALFTGDLSLLTEEDQAYQGITAWLDAPSSEQEVTFVISFGLNDYFFGFPISSEDPLDTGTYCGAVRTAVNTIRANRPDARIILCTPNYIGLYDQGTEPHGDNGYVLTDYVQTVRTLSEELQTELLDNYAELDITAQNHTQYLADQVHPNYAGRFLFAKNLIRLFQ